MFMKRLVNYIVIAAVAMVMAACSGGNSPKGVAEEAVKCIQNGDYEGYVDLIYMEEKEGVDMAEQKKAIVGMIQAKASTTLAKEGGISSYDILSETVAEDGKTANVEMKLVYGNGDEKQENLKLRKTDSGDWRIDAGK